MGLAGELRRVPGLDRRLAEAARLGFTEAVIPADSGSARDRMSSSRHGLLVHRAATIEHALRALSLCDESPSRRGEHGGRRQASGAAAVRPLG